MSERAFATVYGPACMYGSLSRIGLLNVLRFLGSIPLGTVEALRFFVEEVGRMIVLLGLSAVWLLRPPFRGREFVRQLDFAGAQSVLLIVLTGTFTGMVFTLQTYNGMHRYGAEAMVGATVALGLTRELGPVLSALMVVARVGSAMTAELGTMRNTQQIDALTSMAVEPVQYLVVPRIFAVTLVLPLLALIFSFTGMVGAYFIASGWLGIDPASFMSGIRNYLGPEDITHGMIKAVVFGLMVSLVACAKGYYVTGGARGIGVATTRSVVLSSVLVLVSDYVMTSLMF
ncbi:MAG: ABC transporter permease [Desulfomonilaceae bacterium]|nr:ABC transporter permease [Desulfomonilaceae bacterium]